MARPSTVRSRWAKADENQRRAMALRLRRQMGREQLRELLFGLWAGELVWKQWCGEVLGQTPGLVALLQREAGRAFDVEASVSEEVRGLGTDHPDYWRFLESSPTFEKWLHDRMKRDGLSGRKATAIRELRIARLVRLASLSTLALDPSPSSQGIVAKLFSSGCLKEQVVAATIVLSAEGGHERLARLAEGASLKGVAAMADAARRQAGDGRGVSAAGLLAALRRRLVELRFDAGTNREDWLMAAEGLFEERMFVGMCPCEIGRRLEDPARSMAHAQLAALSGKARPAVLRAVERWVEALGLLEPGKSTEVVPREEVLEWARRQVAPSRDEEERIRVGAWAAILSEDCLAGPEDLLEALAAVAAVASGGQSVPVLLGAEVLPWLGWILADLLAVVPRVCGAEGVPVLVTALRVADPYLAAVAHEQIVSLGSCAVPHLMDELRTAEHPGWEVISVLDSLEAEGIEEDLVRLLSAGDRLEVSEAVRVLSVRRDRRVLPEALRLAESDDAGERSLAMFAFFHLRTEEGLDAAIRCLSDSVREVCTAAELAILAMDVPSRLGKLGKAAREGPLLQRMAAIRLIAMVGGEDALSALPDAMETKGELRGHLEAARSFLTLKRRRRHRVG